MPPTPETAPSRKLAVAQVRLIRQAYATGKVSMQTLAELFGVAQETVWKIVHFETWRDV